MIRIENLSLTLPGFKLSSIDLSIHDGEFFVLLGPTGAGKTLVLEAIAGIVSPASGRIIINDQDMTSMPPEDRGIGIVYQEDALFPHLSVRHNITYGIRYLSPEKRMAATELTKLINRLSLDALLNRSVLTLSGGEKQKVALARALAVNPNVLLLDEPLSSLDPNRREDIRILLKRLHQDTGITVMMVTHNFVDAHFFGGRVAVINQGSIEQVGSIFDVFHRPRTPFVADFVGIQNVFKATFKGDIALIGDLSIRLDSIASSEDQYIAIRPEDVHIHPNGKHPAENRKNRFVGKVANIMNKGYQCSVNIMVDDVPFRSFIATRDILANDIKQGDSVVISFDSASIHAL